MRKLLLSTFLLLSCFFLLSKAYSQPLNSKQAEVNRLQNKFLAIFDTSLFLVEVKPNTITAILKDSVLPMGLMSAPYFTDSSAIANPFFKDLWTQYKITVEFKAPHDVPSLSKIYAHNDSLKQIWEDLPRKMGFDHLENLKGMYYPKTKKDRKKILSYVTEVNKLYDEMWPEPRFRTIHWTIFADDDQVYTGNEQHPDWNAYYLVPSSANGLRWKIWEGINKIQTEEEL